MTQNPDIGQIMRQAQEIQKELAKAQAELTEQRFEGTAGGGMVTAVVTGGPELVEVEISPEVVDPDEIEMLEDLVVAAVRQAMDAAVKAANEQLGGISGGLDTGGLFG